MSFLSFEVGVSERGAVVALDFLRYPHLLLGGITNSGKSGVLRAMFASAAHRADVQFIFFDPKMIEGRLYGPRLSHAFTEPDEMLSGLRSLQQVIRSRAASLADQGSDMWAPTVDEPWVFVFFDELAALLATGDSKQRGETERLMHYGITISRALGITFLLSAAKPDTETIPSKIRDGCLTRVCLATVSATGADVTL